MFVSVGNRHPAISNRHRHVLRCKKPDKNESPSSQTQAEKDERVAQAVEELRKVRVVPRNVATHVPKVAAKQHSLHLYFIAYML